jgi:hypothetical protein
MAVFERYHRSEDFLLVLHNEYVGLKHTLDGRGDLVGPQIVDAIKDPCGLDHRYHADEAGVLLG